MEKKRENANFVIKFRAINFAARTGDVLKVRLEKGKEYLIRVEEEEKGVFTGRTISPDECGTSKVWEVPERNIVVLYIENKDPRDKAIREGLEMISETAEEIRRVLGQLEGIAKNVSDSLAT